MKLIIMIIMKWGFLLLTTVMESPKIQKRMIICWCLNMLKMEIYIIIYQKILKRLLGMIRFGHYIQLYWGEVLIFIFIFTIKFIISCKLIIRFIYFIINM